MSVCLLCVVLKATAVKLEPLSVPNRKDTTSLLGAGGHVLPIPSAHLHRGQCDNRVITAYHTHCSPVTRLQTKSNAKE